MKKEKQKLIRDNGLFLTVGQAFARGAMEKEKIWKARRDKVIEIFNN